MIARSLPYVAIPTLPIELPYLGRTVITVFGPLVAIGVVVGYRLCMRMARARNLDERTVDRLAVAVALGGFLGAHWFSMLAYYPARVVENPWVLLPLHPGLSSTGGFIGGALTFAWLCRRWKLDARAHADVIAFGLLAGFALGRIGCALVHDHPGAVATHGWLALGPWPDGETRYDLGLLELLLLVPLLAYVYGRFDPSRARAGQLTVLIAITYGILRIPLDFLRLTDARYGPFTPAQYACLAFVAIAWLWWRRIVSHDFHRVSTSG